MRTLLVALACTVAGAATAQDAPADTARTDAGAPPAQVTEMDAVRVVGERPDPFAFRNPVDYDATAFDRHWDEPPSLEEVGMRGGYVQLGINKTLELAAKGIRKLPGWKGQVRSAEARPPPLDEAQLARAAGLQAAEAAPP